MSILPGSHNFTKRVKTTFFGLQSRIKGTVLEKSQITKDLIYALIKLALLCALFLGSINLSY